MKHSERINRRGTFRRSLFGTHLCGVALAFISLASSFPDSGHGQATAGNGDASPLRDLVTDLRQKNELVGLAAMVMVDGKVVDSAVDGERKHGSGTKLEIGDRWHLGSVTKSITATMVARLVESGQMQWSDSLVDCFPDASIHEDWNSVTLRQLLTHTAGAPANFSFLVRLRHPEPGPECTKVRREAVLNVVANKPTHAPGEHFAYSNVGYTIAGAMAEEATGTPWEDLVKREVFEPLMLTGVGFGPPKSSAEKLEHPRGHVPLFGWKMSVDDDDDNTPIMGPAGTVHMTLRDLCIYATEHLSGHLGTGRLLSAETYQLLHAPEINQYACGWVKKAPPEGIPYTVYWHNGSNRMWYALVVFIPETKMVVAVTSNDGDIKKAEAAAWEVVKANVPPDLAGCIMQSAGYPMKSPFAAVRWQGFQPEVRLGDEWFKLVSLDEMPAVEIVAFSRRTYGDKWRQRIEEDLVELMTGMKHPPQNTVTLGVQSLTTLEASIRKDVSMTEENRSAIKAAARSWAKPSQQRPTRPAVSIDDAVQFRERIDEFLHLARVKAGFSGVVVVARGGEAVYEGAFGLSHLASKTPNSLDTPFRIASLSKQFTAAGILSLEAEGRLSVDAPVHRYLPEFATEPYRGITIYHLLTHTSGLPRTPEDAARHARWDAMHQAATPVNDYVRLACECPLKFEPGQDHEYSNFGYRILSAVIVQITGDAYADFMEEKLFRPLGLRQSGVARISQPKDEADVAEVVSLVSLNSTTRERSFVSTDNGRNYGAGYGSGGIFASANDLLRWDRVLAGDSFLSMEQKAKLFRPVRENYACGWIVKQSDLDGRLYQTHSGSNDGYFSRMMRIPEDDLVIIALGNVRKSDELDEALKQLFRLCRSLPYQDS